VVFLCSNCATEIAPDGPIWVPQTRKRLLNKKWYEKVPMKWYCSFQQGIAKVKKVDTPNSRYLRQQEASLYVFFQWLVINKASYLCSKGQQSALKNPRLHYSSKRCSIHHRSCGVNWTAWLWKLLGSEISSTRLD
jgi:hypothetical protein